MPFDFHLAVPEKRSRSLVRSLHRQLREAIATGRLVPGTRLPSTRAFAEQYAVSRSTAVAVYDRLLSEGFLTTRQGSGTFVAAGARIAPAAPGSGTTARGTRLPPRFVREAKFGSDKTGTVDYDLRLGLPDSGAFPFDIWRRLSNRVLRRPSQATAYARPAGPLPLRRAITTHVSFTRAVACNERRLVATSGAQQAFDLIARCFVEPGKTVVAVEDPGYPPMRATFALAGASIHPVPIDEEGIVVECIPPKTSIVCVTPSHQFPTGVVMSLQRRNALLDFARRSGAIIVEDDYDSEFRYGGDPLDALQTLDKDGAVFYVGTFSKSIFPALRQGFVAVPDWALEALTTVKKLTDWHGPTLQQLILATFIEEGHLARHIRRMRKAYSRRREALLAGLDGRCKQWLTPIPAAAGLHVAAEITADLDPGRIADRCGLAGVQLETLDKYSMSGRGPKGLGFGFGSCPYEGIDEAVTRIAEVAGSIPVSRR